MQLEVLFLNHRDNLCDCTWRKVCPGATPVLVPGAVNGGDSGGVSLRCFGGVDTMKNILLP